MSRGWGSVRAFLLLAVLGTAACSEHQDAVAPPEGGGAVVVIDVRNFEFSEGTVTVAPGTTVRWVNRTTTFHTVTPADHDTWEEWQTSGMGESFEVRFDAAGTYPYYCSPHRALGMTGRVVVQ